MLCHFRVYSKVIRMSVSQFTHPVLSNSCNPMDCSMPRFFSSTSLSALRVVSSAYLRLLIFLPAILIPSCALSRPALTSLVAQMVKCLSTMRETRIQSLGWEDPLEKEMAALSSILAWKISWTEEPGGLQSMGSQRVWHD